jgi:hypothetical protein
MPGQRRRERNTVLALLFVELFLVGLFVITLAHERWANAGLSLSLAIAIPCWAFIVKVPTNCGVVTSKGEPCSRTAYGILIGCTGAEGHVWAKVFARFGWHNQRLPVDGLNSDAASHASAYTSAALNEHATIPVLVTIAEDRKASITFWLGVLSAFTGAVSAFTSVIPPR